MRPLNVALLLLALPLLAQAAEYRIGPGQPYESIGAVPWESLGPGDTVLIHARPTPYAEKWVILLQRLRRTERLRLLALRPPPE